MTNPRVELVYSPHVIRESLAFMRTHKAKREEPTDADLDWGGTEKNKEDAEAQCVFLRRTIEWMQNEIQNKRTEAMKAESKSEPDTSNKEA